MITIQLLEPNDVIDPKDWCRPLNVLYDSPQSDQISFISPYSGSPINNMKWCQVDKILGKVWFGKKVRDYNIEAIVKMEFVSGNIPEDHKL